MITVDERPATVTTSEASGLLPGRLRYIALRAIADGVTPGELRSRSAGTAREVVDKQVADEAVYLAAHGVTGRVASRAAGEIARLAVRRVAATMLRQEGPAAVGMCRQAADTAGTEGDDVTRRSFLEFAAAAELLLAERAASSLN